MGEDYDSNLLRRLAEDGIDLSKRGFDDEAVLCLKRALGLKLDVFRLGIPKLKKAYCSGPQKRDSI